MAEKTCRCGWAGVGEHPCHGDAYRCGQPGRERYYEPNRSYSLAGAHPKMSVAQTVACDACWRLFTEGRP